MENGNILFQMGLCEDAERFTTEGAAVISQMRCSVIEPASGSKQMELRGIICRKDHSLQIV